VEAAFGEVSYATRVAARKVLHSFGPVFAPALINALRGLDLAAFEDRAQAAYVVEWIQHLTEGVLGAPIQLDADAAEHDAQVIATFVQDWSRRAGPDGAAEYARFREEVERRRQEADARRKR
jgi:hypothetical protein